MVKDERGESNENSNIPLSKIEQVKRKINSNEEGYLAEIICKEGGRKEGEKKERNHDKDKYTMMAEKLEKSDTNSNRGGEDEIALTPAFGRSLYDGSMGNDERGGESNNKTERNEDGHAMDDNSDIDEDYSEEGYKTPQARQYVASEARLMGLSPERERFLSISTSNALDSFAVVQGLMSDLSLIVLLDYDGTLTPIVSDPAEAVLRDSVRGILQDLTKHFITGVISGRSLAKIRDFVKVPGLYYAGSHGFDILAPRPCPSHTDLVSLEDLDSSYTRYQVGVEYLPVLQVIRSELAEGIKSLPGASVEDNMYAISLHYRNCDRKFIPEVDRLARGVLDRHEGLRLRRGKEVYEIQPDIKWNKGSAVIWLLEMLGLITDVPVGGDVWDANEDGVVSGNELSKVFTLFIGDDLSDEDAFKLFTGMHEGRQPGLGILVSEESRHTHAAFTLHNPMEVADFLSRLVGVGQSRGLSPIPIRAKHNVEIKGVKMGKTPSVKDIAEQIRHFVETDSECESSPQRS